MIRSHLVAPLSNFGMINSLAGRPLGTAALADEFLHPPALSGHYSATETSYFGFNVPEHALNGEIYIWFHPILKIMSVSVYIWRCFHASTLSCDYVNHYHYLPFPDGDIGDYTIDEIGLRIRVLEPLRTVQIEFRDAERDVELSLLLRAIMPPAVRPGGFHFTQAMRTSGTLRLHDERFTIDGWFTRDRSWGQERRETSRLIPPFTWMAGVVDDDFAFHVLAFDSVDGAPDWLSRYQLADFENLVWGYVRQDGETQPLIAARKSTRRGADGLSPTGYSLVLRDAAGVSHEIHGEVRARMPWQTWQNINVHFCQTRWHCARGIGWGDSQDIQQNDFIHHFARN
ncbi:hypothetical protein ACG33_01985 [Steroidobacter denitrificans]|uniref:DUF7064 domain-containing protein n=1 Tax=Steroidobacter denitrificans TaxID=465721 RepID=A0A127F8G7_STEDE|nr:hypothetical protein [Steroidobacter denitrificans]AMN45898.1 hypothetical protein ACG33_01985 [Steroidobacter denitrificans]